MSSLTKQIETKVNNEENKKANLLQLLTEENKNKFNDDSELSMTDIE